MVSPEYYFISDLHIGGEGNLTICDFETELIDFLQLLEDKTSSTKLIIVGDAFSFWEMPLLLYGNELDRILQLGKDSI